MNMNVFQGNNITFRSKITKYLNEKIGFSNRKRSENSMTN